MKSLAHKFIAFLTVLMALTAIAPFANAGMNGNLIVNFDNKTNEEIKTSVDTWCANGPQNGELRIPANGGNPGIWSGRNSGSCFFEGRRLVSISILNSQTVLSFEAQGGGAFHYKWQNNSWLRDKNITMRTMDDGTNLTVFLTINPRP